MKLTTNLKRLENKLTAHEDIIGCTQYAVLTLRTQPRPIFIEFISRRYLCELQILIKSNGKIARDFFNISIARKLKDSEVSIKRRPKLEVKGNFSIFYVPKSIILSIFNLIKSTLTVFKLQCNILMSGPLEDKQQKRCEYVENIKFS